MYELMNNISAARIVHLEIDKEFEKKVGFATQPSGITLIPLGFPKQLYFHVSLRYVVASLWQYLGKSETPVYLSFTNRERKNRPLEEFSEIRFRRGERTGCDVKVQQRFSANPMHKAYLYKCHWFFFVVPLSRIDLVRVIGVKYCGSN
jgi:hypothetical protein